MRDFLGVLVLPRNDRRRHGGGCGHLTSNDHVASLSSQPQSAGLGVQQRPRSISRRLQSHLPAQSHRLCHGHGRLLRRGAQFFTHFSSDPKTHHLQAREAELLLRNGTYDYPRMSKVLRNERVLLRVYIYMRALSHPDTT